jgi:hypothetical protein
MRGKGIPWLHTGLAKVNGKKLISVHGWGPSPSG